MILAIVSGSLDYTLSFHVGVGARVAAKEGGAPDGAERLRLLPVWRRWGGRSRRALSAAEEAEEFQAVGTGAPRMLDPSGLFLIGAPKMVPAGQVAPKRRFGRRRLDRNTSLIHSPPGQAESTKWELRGHSPSPVGSWRIGWTHKSTANQADASFVLEATDAVISALAMGSNAI